MESSSRELSIMASSACRFAGLRFPFELALLRNGMPGAPTAGALPPMPDFEIVGDLRRAVDGIGGAEVGRGGNVELRGVRRGEMTRSPATEAGLLHRMSRNDRDVAEGVDETINGDEDDFVAGFGGSGGGTDFLGEA